MEPEIIQRLPTTSFPPLLREMPDPPHTLYIRGILPSPDTYIYLSVVGSRNCSIYGKEVCEYLIGGLANYPIAIVSGLAYGIDTIAHHAALTARLPTIAIPGSGLSWNTLYPKANHPLARSIIEHGGALLSEYRPDFHATRWSFPQRNRLMAGIARATLLIEAGEKSGTLITARLASEYDRDVYVVPGSIFSPTHSGIHQFLKLGATPITSPEDIWEMLKVYGTGRD